MVEEKTKEECQDSPSGNHRPVEKADSKTGYICSCCNKEVHQLCQFCNKPKSAGEWNPYYLAHEECMKGKGRIGS